MKLKNKLQSGTLFLRNFILGILLIIIALVSFSYFQIGNEYSSVLSGLALLIINIFIVLIYTRAVLLNEEILAQEDSSDLAYYLGFCLTVTTLALSFGIEALRQPFSKDSVLAAAESSNLIKGSLIQFAAGLFATLAGLCAKIYISSEQSKLVAEPEELYRQFRQEIYGFQTEIKGAVSEISSSFNVISNGLIKSAEQTSFSIASFLKTIDESTKLLNSNFDSFKLEKFAVSFNENIQKLQDNVNILASTMQTVSTDMVGLSKNSNDLNLSFLEISSHISNINNDFNNFQNTILSITSILKLNLESFILLENSLQATNKSVSSFDSSLNDTSERIGTFSNQTLLNFTNQVNIAADQTAALIEKNQKYLTNLELLINNTQTQVKTNRELDESYISLISNNERTINFSNQMIDQIEKASNLFIALNTQISTLDFNSLSDSFNKLKNSIIPVSTSLNDSAISTENHSRALISLEDKLNQYSQKIDTLNFLSESLKSNVNLCSESFLKLTNSINSLPNVISSVEQSLEKINKNITS